jgi:hypothetical protein
MCPRGVSILLPPSCSKSKDEGKSKVEDTSSDDSEQQTKLSTIVLKWIDPRTDWISFSDIPFYDPCNGTMIIDAIMRKYKKRET